MTTSTQHIGSMGATRCGGCHRTTEFRVVTQTRRLFGAIAVGAGRWVAECTACGAGVEMSRSVAKASVSTIGGCGIRPAISTRAA